MLYHWQSEALKQYGDGHLIAAAGGVEDARKHIREAFPAWLEEHRSWLVYDAAKDEDSAADLAKLWESLERDLAADPEISNAALISGSE